MSNGHEDLDTPGGHSIGVIQRLTDCTLDLIEPAHGVMVGVADRTTVTYVAGAGNQSTLVGTQVGIHSSLSGVALLTGEVQFSDDTEEDPRVDLEACRRHFVRSLICVPLTRRRQTIGVLAVNAPEPNVFSSAHIDHLTRLAGFISTAIASALDLHEVELLSYPLESGAGGEPAQAAADAELYVAQVLDPDGREPLELARKVEAILADPTLLSIVYQPIVDLRTGDVAAIEALSRFAVVPYRTPDRWFADAHRCHHGIDLELLALEQALLALPFLDGRTLAVNAGPELAASPKLLATLADRPLHNVILELTEHTFVEDYPALLAALRPLRRNGLRVAIDDTGAGYSSLAHILKVAPDFIKLDCELTTGIDFDPVRRALAASLVSFAAETGAQIIAEGVESADELEVLQRLGIPFAQGFHLCPPSTLEAVTSFVRSG